MSGPFKARRWIAVCRGEALEIAVTTANGKRLKPITRQEATNILKKPEMFKLYPLAQTVRVTPRPTDTLVTHAKP